MPGPPLLHSSCIRSRTPYTSCAGSHCHACLRRLSSTDSRRISSRTVSFFFHQFHAIRIHGSVQNIPCRCRSPCPLAFFLVSYIQPGCHICPYVYTNINVVYTLVLPSPAIPFLIASKSSRTRFLAPLCRGATSGCTCYRCPATGCMLTTPRLY